VRNISSALPWFSLQEEPPKSSFLTLHLIREEHTHTHKSLLSSPYNTFFIISFQKEAFFMIFLQWVYLICQLLVVLFSLDYNLFLLCKMSHPCDGNNASNTFWLMMTNGDGSCVVVILVVIVEHKFSKVVHPNPNPNSNPNFFLKSWEQVEKFHNKEFTRDTYLGRYSIITRVQDFFHTTLLATLKQSWNLASPSIAYHDTTITSLPWQLWH